ncbi:uncharacterized protein LOC117572315 [Drosophila albomicans]|uniref:Uncharacterized protein LOC117572315 n=1 Tax=Drosophila albomicans TaxID=7291 RepID=A0A6P8Z1T9_DROAB|nr:uncharacterized protein LOC117572315 [Drosophila albomicans]
MWMSFLILLLAFEGHSATVSRFTNVECKILDIGYITYPKCYLKLLGRDIVGLNIHLKLLKPPVETVKVNLSLWRKFSGYRPFMFNSTFDYCKYAENPTFSFQHIVFSAIKESSNINHTCPYDHDIIVQNMIFKEEYLRLLPLPAGEYQFQLLIATYNKWRTVIKATILHNENLMYN